MGEVPGKTIQTERDATEFEKFVAGRSRVPLVLLAMKKGAMAPPVNATELEREIPGVAVVTVATGLAGRVGDIFDRELDPGAALVVDPSGLAGDVVRGTRPQLQAGIRSAMADVGRSPLISTAAPGLSSRAGLQYARDRDEAVALATRLLTADREFPIVVVGTPPGVDGTWIDAGHIARELTDIAEVWLLTTGAPSWAFSDAMPPDTQVFGAAARAYPPRRSLAQRPLRVAAAPVPITRSRCHSRQQGHE